MDDNKDESIISHINELRETLLRCIYALAIGIIPMLFAAPKVLDLFIKLLIKDSNVVLNYFSPTEVFLIQIKTAFVLDLIICFPYIAKQVWNFLVPALYEHEKKFISSIVLTSSILFIFGAGFCLCFILPLIIRFGLSFVTSNIQAVFGISNVINISLWLIIAFGLMFQFPLITYSLIKSEIVSYETVSDKRPYVAVGLLILAALLTPPDIVSQILLFIPTYLLFELGLFLARRHK
ncbi:MAG: twin-arginine translocase subunit TatC [Candidatus Gastranaerophilales bacterium]|nr:twin-arginine translocase subunit TatC [Candidatus Gastranaerophilales bacterium]